MNQLSNQKCVPCVSGATPLKGANLERFKSELGEGWHLVNDHHLEKEYHFKNFIEALEYVNDIGRIAEQEGHHPDIFLT